MDSDQGSEYIPSSASDASPPSPSEAVRKRRRKPTEPLPAPPLKRAKGVFNPRYLAVLNEDIADATSGLTREDPHSSTLPSPLLPLTHSQLGAVLWTATEKQAFFSALARLGRDDLPGIAARISSKSALEVHQYTTLLDAAARARRSDETKRRRAPRPVDIPSATELSTELSAALEAAGDSLALRQEAHEASLEQKRWGGRWLITAELASVLEHQLQQQRRRRRGESNADDELMPTFVELFHLRNWVRLAERVFMNASVARFADGNWRSVAEERPAVRATALADFYSLAVSVTRRLVSAALFVAGSRVRAKQAVDRRGRISAVVKTKDVQAAVASVGMKENSREFWARAARRLRLDVYGDEDEDGDGEEGSARTDDENLEDEEEGADEKTEVDTASEDDSSEEEGQSLSDADSGYEDYESEPDIMPYAAVEAALGFPSTNTASRAGDSDNELREVSGFNISLDSGSDSDFISDEFSDEEDAGISDHNQDDEDMPMKSSPGSPTEPPIDTEALEQDLIEALTYSALDYGDTTRSRQALRNRLKIEQRLWADAERLDERASAAEEARLWSLLRGDEAIRAKTEEKEPDLLMLESESELKLSGRRTGLADLSGNWRDHTEYYSEWEFAEGNRLGGPNG